MRKQDQHSTPFSAKHTRIQESAEKTQEEEKKPLRRSARRPPLRDKENYSDEDYNPSQESGAKSPPRRKRESKRISKDGEVFKHANQPITQEWLSENEKNFRRVFAYLR